MSFYLGDGEGGGNKLCLLDNSTCLALTVFYFTTHPFQIQQFVMGGVRVEREFVKPIV